jgi:hypothetical protein
VRSRRSAESQLAGRGIDQFGIIRVAGSSLVGRARIRDQVINVLEQRYVDPEQVFDLFAPETSRLYVAVRNGQWIALHFVKSHLLDIADFSGCSAVRSVLSVAANGHRSGCALRSAYSATMMDAAASSPRPMFLWGTTALPSVYRLASRLLTDIQPHPDGTYSQTGLAMASHLWRLLGVAKSRDEHPFVTTGIYPQLGLVDEAAYSTARAPDLFLEHKVAAAGGNRILFVGRIATDEGPLPGGVPL